MASTPTLLFVSTNTKVEFINQFHQINAFNHKIFWGLMSYCSSEQYHCIILEKMEILNILLMSCVKKYFFLYDYENQLSFTGRLMTGYQTFMSENKFYVNLIFFLPFDKYDIHPFIHCYRSKWFTCFSTQYLECFLL